MNADTSLYPAIAYAIANEAQMPDVTRVSRILGKNRLAIKHLMSRMRDAGLLEVVPGRGRRGVSNIWRLTTRGQALLNGYEPAGNYDGRLRRLNCVPLMQALNMPLQPPPLSPYANVREVTQK